MKTMFWLWMGSRRYRRRVPDVGRVETGRRPARGVCIGGRV